MRHLGGVGRGDSPLYGGVEFLSAHDCLPFYIVKIFFSEWKLIPGIYALGKFFINVLFAYFDFMEIHTDA